MPEPVNPKITKTSTRANFKPCGITHEQAKLRFFQMEKPSIRGLHTILNAEGIRISEYTIARWHARHLWASHLQTHRKILDSEVLGVIKLMNVEGDRLSELAFKGAQARLIAHLGKAINKVECKTPKDVNELLEACEKLRAMSHSVRGEVFSDVRKAAESITNGPVVNLGTFKPSVVKNGHGNGKDGSHE